MECSGVGLARTAGRPAAGGAVSQTPGLPWLRWDGSAARLNLPRAHTRCTPLAGCVQVHAFKEHHAAVTELSFDQTAEYLGSSSEDGTVVVREGVCSGWVAGRE